ncbi:hypothetical protein CXB51_007916 [Gossypium anomalum]|uniref:Uncharacterized protein n=1 Tax=Gossypium anomalum TaxID=47600 RepID=A0A8J5Z8D0_9ROSI|nr:hypothetical protein CXB51_007916 [Gossypium anomalum]
MGALVNMTPQRARELISTMAANSQQFRLATEPTRLVHGLNSLSLEDKIDKLTNVVQILLIDKTGPARTVQRRYDPYSNSYNVGWKDHPNLCYGSNSQFNQPYQQRLPPNQQLLPPKSSLEAIVERLVNSTEKFQLKTEMHLQELDKQVSKLALTISRLESQDLSNAKRSEKRRRSLTPFER